ncbi:MAG: ADP-forming succinate--CoA ligase subunit beta [Candidatus Hydrogenedentota bacterium]
MKLHEYQAKALFREYDIPCPSDCAADSADEAVKAANEMGLPVVIKAQVHVGGRGKAGGVKVVTDAAELQSTAEAILSLTIKELPVRKVMVTPCLNIATEVYLSVLLDRSSRSVMFVGCADGGVEIEETAKTSPEKILTLECTSTELKEPNEAKLLEFAQKLFEGESQAQETVEMMKKMGKLFIEKDASLIEINPLITNDKGTVIALDAKMMIDDNALFRHPELEELRDMDSEDIDELEAGEKGLSFIRLDGNIGCMVNGAGLAMATMDTIKHFGGNPANFLDVGGSSNPEKVVEAFKLILKDENVKSILINIFGGITRCDDIANGILESLKVMDVPVPIVVRLVGTNEKEGRALLEGTKLGTATTLEDGATQVAKFGESA